MEKRFKDESTVGTPLAAPLIAQALERTQISKYHTKGGHGFAAEDANHFADCIRGANAQIVGTSNEMHGADRLVNATRIQSKYCQTPVDTIAAAFDSTLGRYRYDGQMLEVPSDQYEACLDLMRKRISKGQVSGTADPADAEKIVRKGSITYKQARNIARAGNIDSVIYDVQTQAVSSSYVFALSFAVSFSQNIWRGQAKKEAVKDAVVVSIASGSTAFVTGIVSAQILRMRIAAVGRVTVQKGVKALSRSAVGREAVQRLATGSLGKAVYGAAATNHLAKLVRTNLITSAIASVATITPDFYRAAFDRSISWKQLGKNCILNVAGVAGGSVGWAAGAATGAAVGSFVPMVGTALGAVVGGVAGALAGGSGTFIAAESLVDTVVEDDSIVLLAILREEIETLAFEYMLNEQEIKLIGESVSRIANSEWLRRMYKVSLSGDSQAVGRQFVRQEFEPLFAALIEQRPKVPLPAFEDLEADITDLVLTIEPSNLMLSHAASENSIVH